jgi:hypothetical protein
MIPDPASYAILCHRDGSICSAYGAFLCPDFPGIDSWDDPTLQDIREHIRANGLSVETLLNAVLAIHAVLNAGEWSPDTPERIFEILNERLGLTLDPCDQFEDEA